LFGFEFELNHAREKEDRSEWGSETSSHFKASDLINEQSFKIVINLVDARERSQRGERRAMRGVIEASDAMNDRAQESMSDSDRKAVAHSFD
jgi:hypothetical protein